LCREQRSSGEVDAKTLTPDGDSTILGEVNVRRQLVILIANVAFNAAEIDKAGFLYSLVILGVGCRDEINMHVRPVGSFECAKAKHILAIG